MQPANIYEPLTEKATPANREQIIRVVNDAFAKDDMTLFLSHCTNNVVWNMIGDKTLEGKDSIRQAMTAQPGNCPDITVDTVITEGNKTVGVGRFSINNKEGLQETFQYCDVYTFEDEKIAAMDSYVVSVKP